jgi:hypothetical protein
MRPLDKVPDPGPLPRHRRQEEFLNQFIEDTSRWIERAKDILDSNVDIASAPYEEAGTINAGPPVNANTGTIEVAWTVATGATQAVDNPLGREPIGFTVIDQCGDEGIHHTYTTFGSTLSITASSTTLTDASSGFTSGMASGFFFDGSYRVKIDTVSSAGTITLRDAWPGSTISAGTGIVQHKWADDEFYLTASVTSNNVWARILVF